MFYLAMESLSYTPSPQPGTLPLLQDMLLIFGSLPFISAILGARHVM